MQYIVSPLCLLATDFSISYATNLQENSWLALLYLISYFVKFITFFHFSKLNPNFILYFCVSCFYLFSQWKFVSLPCIDSCYLLYLSLYLEHFTCIVRTPLFYNFFLYCTLRLFILTKEFSFLLLACLRI